MSGNAPEIQVPLLPHARIAIISARWHHDLCDQLVAGALRAVHKAGVKQIDQLTVSGSFELPIAAAYALDGGADAAIVLGVIIRGETPHFDYVCQGVTHGIMQTSLDLKKPIGFGVLTVESMDQALSRVGGPGSKEDKGFDAAIAALDLLRVKDNFLKK
jgi:6,7-dimethyl-8-ribityllumazine synthase